MMFNSTLPILLIIFIIIWNIVVTLLLVRMKRHYDRLTGKTGAGKLSEVLDSFLDFQSKQEKNNIQFEKNIKLIADEAQYHIQRIGIVRFNPFSDTGGTQSFTIALLDGKNNGVVMTSLYARTGNRWYIKQVKDGRGVGLELSREEISAIEKAGKK